MAFGQFMGPRQSWALSAYTDESPPSRRADGHKLGKGLAPCNPVRAEFVQALLGDGLVLGCYSGILKGHIDEVYGLVRVQQVTREACQNGTVESAGK